jgi:hypothetical protein
MSMEERLMEFSTILYNGCVKLYMCRGPYGINEFERGARNRLIYLYEHEYSLAGQKYDTFAEEFKSIAADANAADAAYKDFSLFPY